MFLSPSDCHLSKLRFDSYNNVANHLSVHVADLVVVRIPCSGALFSGDHLVCDKPSPLSVHVISSYHSNADLPAPVKRLEQSHT